MISNKEIRTIARQELKGFWTMPVLATLVYCVITFACQISVFCHCDGASNAILFR